MVERCYVYAIVEPTIHMPEHISGFGGPLVVLSCGELGAVVSKVHAADMDSAIPPPSGENLLRHEMVVEALGAQGRVLPARFGTALADGEAVTRALKRHLSVLRDDLRRIGDKVEMGVSAFWPLSEENTESTTIAVDTPGADTESENHRPGLVYLRARQVKYRQTESARARAQILAQALDAELRPYALQFIRNVCPSERLALRDLYLLERVQVSAFEKAFDEMRRRHQEAHFLLSGPWPPYSFVTPLTQRDEETQSVDRWAQSMPGNTNSSLTNEENARRSQRVSDFDRSSERKG
jgi:hypothetical protein